MLKELKPNEFERVRPLFRGFDYSLSIHAAIERNREYTYYYYMCDPIDHLAELGWYYYRRGEYARTVRYYEHVFALRDENPDYYYHLTASAWALLGNREKALQYLHAAADHGWTNVEWTRQQEEFDFLHDAPKWDAVLARMRA